MEHEWRGDVTRAGDGDANVIFVFFRFLIFFWWDTTRFSINLVEKGKGLTFTAKIIVGLTMYVRIDHDAHLFSKESLDLEQHATHKSLHTTQRLHIHNKYCPQ